jgi:hypothetical protein
MQTFSLTLFPSSGLYLCPISIIMNECNEYIFNINMPRRLIKRLFFIFIKYIFILPHSPGQAWQEPSKECALHRNKSCAEDTGFTNRLEIE